MPRSHQRLSAVFSSPLRAMPACDTSYFATELLRNMEVTTKLAVLCLSLAAYWICTSESKDVTVSYVTAPGPKYGRLVQVGIVQLVHGIVTDITAYGCCSSCFRDNLSLVRSADRTACIWVYPPYAWRGFKFDGAQSQLAGPLIKL